MFFISPQKLFSFSRYLSFDFLVVYQNGLIKDVRDLLTNNCNTHTAKISRSKGNWTMKFGQLIECNIRNIFLEKSYAKFGGETSPRPFSEKLKLNLSLDEQSKVLYSLLFLQRELKAIETKLQTTCFHLILSFFKK